MVERGSYFVNPKPKENYLAFICSLLVFLGLLVLIFCMTYFLKKSDAASPDISPSNEAQLGGSFPNVAFIASTTSKSPVDDKEDNLDNNQPKQHEHQDNNTNTSLNEAGVEDNTKNKQRNTSFDTNEVENKDLGEKTNISDTNEVEHKSVPEVNLNENGYNENNKSSGIVVNVVLPIDKKNQTNIANEPKNKNVSEEVDSVTKEKKNGYVSVDENKTNQTNISSNPTKDTNTDLSTDQNKGKGTNTSSEVVVNVVLPINANETKNEIVLEDNHSGANEDEDDNSSEDENKINQTNELSSDENKRKETNTAPEVVVNVALPINVNKTENDIVSGVNEDENEKVSVDKNKIDQTNVSFSTAEDKNKDSSSDENKGEETHTSSKAVANEILPLENNNPLNTSNVHDAENEIVPEDTHSAAHEDTFSRLVVDAVLPIKNNNLLNISNVNDTENEIVPKDAHSGANEDENENVPVNENKINQTNILFSAAQDMNKNVSLDENEGKETHNSSELVVNAILPIENNNQANTSNVNDAENEIEPEDTHSGANHDENENVPVNENNINQTNIIFSAAQDIKKNISLDENEGKETHTSSGLVVNAVLPIENNNPLNTSNVNDAENEIEPEDTHFGAHDDENENVPVNENNINQTNIIFSVAQDIKKNVSLDENEGKETHTFSGLVVDAVLPMENNNQLNASNVNDTENEIVLEDTHSGANEDVPVNEKEINKTNISSSGRVNINKNVSSDESKGKETHTSSGVAVVVVLPIEKNNQANIVNITEAENQIEAEEKDSDANGVENKGLTVAKYKSTQTNTSDVVVNVHLIVPKDKKLDKQTNTSSDTAGDLNKPLTEGKDKNVPLDIPGFKNGIPLDSDGNIKPNTSSGLVVNVRLILPSKNDKDNERNSLSNTANDIPVDEHKYKNTNTSSDIFVNVHLALPADEKKNKQTNASFGTPLDENQAQQTNISTSIALENSSAIENKNEQTNTSSGTILDENKRKETNTSINTAEVEHESLFSIEIENKLTKASSGVVEDALVDKDKKTQINTSSDATQVDYENVHIDKNEDKIDKNKQAQTSSNTTLNENKNKQINTSSSETGDINKDVSADENKNKQSNTSYKIVGDENVIYLVGENKNNRPNASFSSIRDVNQGLFPDENNTLPINASSDIVKDVNTELSSDEDNDNSEKDHINEYLLVDEDKNNQPNISTAAVEDINKTVTAVENKDSQNNSSSKTIEEINEGLMVNISSAIIVDEVKDLSADTDKDSRRNLSVNQTQNLLIDNNNNNNNNTNNMPTIYYNETVREDNNLTLVQINVTEEKPILNVEVVDDTPTIVDDVNKTSSPIGNNDTKTIFSSNKLDNTDESLSKEKNNDTQTDVGLTDTYNDTLTNALNVEDELNKTAQLSVNESINLQTNLPEMTKTCDSFTCKKFASTMLARINHSISPCEDFYQFACGGNHLNEDNFREKMFDRIIADNYKGSPPTFTKFITSCKMYNSDFNFIERKKSVIEPDFNSLKIESLIAEMVRLQTMYFFDIGVTVGKDSHLRFLVTTTKDETLKTTVSGWSMVDHFKNKCFEKHTRHLTIDASSEQIERSNNDINNCLINDIRIYLEGYANENNVDLNGVHELVHLLKVHLRHTSLPNSDFDSLNITEFDNTYKQLWDIKWNEVFQSLSRNFHPDGYIIVQNEEIKEMFRKFGNMSNLIEVLSLWHNVQLYHNIVMNGEENNEYYCLNLAFELMPDVAANLVYSRYMTSEITRNEVVYVYQTFDKLKRNSNSVFSDIINDMTNFRIYTLTNSSDYDFDQSDYVNLHVNESDFSANFKYLLRNYRTKLYNFVNEEVSIHTLLMYFIDIFETKPKMIKPVNTIVYQPRFLELVSADAPKFISNARISYSVAQEMLDGYYYDGGDMFHNDNIKDYGINSTQEENIDIIVENAAYRLFTDYYEKTNSTYTEPIVFAYPTYSIQQMFLIFAAQDYCKKGILEEKMFDVTDPIPPRMKIKNTAKNSQFFYRTFGCSETGVSWPSIKPTTPLSTN